MLLNTMVLPVGGRCIANVPGFMQILDKMLTNRPTHSRKYVTSSYFLCWQFGGLLDLLHPQSALSLVAALEVEDLLAANPQDGVDVLCDDREAAAGVIVGLRANRCPLQVKHPLLVLPRLVREVSHHPSASGS